MAPDLAMIDFRAIWLWLSAHVVSARPSPRHPLASTCVAEQGVGE